MVKKSAIYIGFFYTFFCIFYPEMAQPQALEDFFLSGTFVKLPDGNYFKFHIF